MNEEVIKRIMKFRYTKEEAINILNGLNSDGTKFIKIPF